MDVIFLDRRMFPTVRCSFLNLRPDQRYWVLLDIVPCDNKRYRYAYHRSSWLVAGKADPPPPHRLYTHPDSPFTGDQLRKQVVSFEKVKLTNNEMDKNGQVRSWVRFCHNCTHSLEWVNFSSDPTTWMRKVSRIIDSPYSVFLLIVHALAVKPNFEGSHLMLWKIDWPQGRK